MLSTLRWFCPNSPASSYRWLKPEEAARRNEVLQDNRTNLRWALAFIDDGIHEDPTHYFTGEAFRNELALFAETKGSFLSMFCMDLENPRQRVVEMLEQQNLPTKCLAILKAMRRALKKIASKHGISIEAMVYGVEKTKQFWQHLESWRLLHLVHTSFEDSRAFELAVACNTAGNADGYRAYHLVPVDSSATVALLPDPINSAPFVADAGNPSYGQVWDPALAETSSEEHYLLTRLALMYPDQDMVGVVTEQLGETEPTLSVTFVSGDGTKTTVIVPAASIEVTRWGP